MARITASVYTSHVPAIGAALDLGKTEEPYWQQVFAGYDFSKRWLQANRPDAIVLVYNDHASAFDANIIPTFAIERAQELIYYLSRLVHGKRIPNMPVYLDSPMAVEATQIYRHHAELFDDDLTRHAYDDWDPPELGSDERAALRRRDYDRRGACGRAAQAL